MAARSDRTSSRVRGEIRERSVNMTMKHAAGGRSLTIRQIGEAEVVRLRQRGIAQPSQTRIGQKDDTGPVRMTEWRREARRLIIDP